MKSNGTFATFAIILQILSAIGTYSPSVKNLIFQTGLICVKTLPFLEMNDSAYKEVEARPGDFNVEVKGYSLIKNGVQYKFPLGLAIVVHSSHIKHNYLIGLALSEYLQPVGKYFTKFMAKNKACAPARPSTKRFNPNCEARSDYFKGTQMFYLEKDMTVDSTDIYWSPISQEVVRSYEFVQFYFLAVNTNDKTFYTNIESETVSVIPPEGEDQMAERRIKLKIASRSRRNSVKPEDLTELDQFEIHCAPLELGSYHIRQIQRSGKSYMDPSLYAENYGCVGNAAKCIQSRSCETIITFRTAKASTLDAIHIQIFSKLHSNVSYGYTAVGLSLDDQMGDDMVVECAVAETGRSNVYLSWNYPQKTNKRIDGLECNPNSMLITSCSLLIDQENGLFKCEFFLRDKFIFNENRFDLVFQSYYIFHASGTNLTETNIGKHDRTFISKNKIALNTIKEPRSLIQYVQIHSSVMVVVWIVLVPNAIFLARYFKESWTNRLILGRRIYFTLHVSVMVVGFFCLVVAIGSILYVTFQKRKRWNDAPEVQGHMKIGGGACILFLVQIFSGWVRPIDEWSRRIFSIGHWIIGTCAVFLGFANLLQSSNISDTHVPCCIPILVIVWLIWTILCHIIMAFHFRWIDSMLGRMSKRGFSPLPMQNVTFASTPGYGKRLAIWFVYFFGSVLLAGGMIAAIITSTEDCDCRIHTCYI
ncbi:unnamed protein product [Allacma fusca]|uniref:Ferric-chelate reductase 1 n=1 Tax=Allacma fusca TaxID=39272 RepID=A0A8J2KVA3_9HEXA|nr:unnamed protein product [Allacma fusca]